LPNYLERSNIFRSDAKSNPQFPRLLGIRL